MQDRYKMFPFWQQLSDAEKEAAVDTEVMVLPSAVLKQLTRQNPYVELKRGTITILDKEKLRTFCNE